MRLPDGKEVEAVLETPSTTVPLSLSRSHTQSLTTAPAAAINPLPSPSVRPFFHFSERHVNVRTERTHGCAQLAAITSFLVDVAVVCRTLLASGLCLLGLLCSSSVSSSAHRLQLAAVSLT